MIKELNLNYDQIKVISFTSLYTGYIEPKLLDDLAKYHCIGPALDRTAQRLFLHHVIHSTCEYILNLRMQSKIVIYYSETEIVDTKTFDQYDNKKLQKIFNQISKIFQSKLPIRWYNGIYPFSYFKICHDNNKNDGIIIKNNIKSLCNEDFTAFLFDKIKIYTKTNNLTFLDKTYFNQLRSKMLLVA